MNSGWPLAGLLIMLFGLFAFGHAYCLIRYLVNRTPFSVVPFLGGILGAIGFWLDPEPMLQHLWWMPPLLDYGSVPSLVSWFIALIRHRA